MTVKGLKEYLNQFDDSEVVGFMVANLKRDVMYKISAYELIDPQELAHPVIMLECGKEEPLSKYRRDEDGKEEANVDAQGKCDTEQEQAK